MTANYSTPGNTVRNYDDLHVRLRDTRFWCVQFCASIGLNMNSTAVIIGAMLIHSHDTDCWTGIPVYFYLRLIKQSLEVLLTQVLVSLVSRLCISWISPCVCSSELIARTSPTILGCPHCFIANWDCWCGQFQGKKLNNIVPGVAITSLWYLSTLYRLWLAEMYDFYLGPFIFSWSTVSLSC